MFQYLGTIWIVVNNILDNPVLNIKETRNLAGFIIMAQGMKAVLDWLRLFDNTNFYVTLIIKTILDIGYFSMILGFVLYYIGAAVYMI